MQKENDIKTNQISRTRIFLKAVRKAEEQQTASKHIVLKGKNQKLKDFQEDSQSVD